MKQATQDNGKRTERRGEDGDNIVCCSSKLDRETKIFRYLPVDRYLELIEEGFNALTHLTLWEDPYEAFILRAGITYLNGDKREDIYNVFKNVYGQSWTLREEESDVIWRAMVKRGDGVRIQTTVGKLANSLRLSKGNNTRIEPVTYVDKARFDALLICDELNQAVNGDVDDKLSFFFMKRNEFSLEDEVRVIAIPDESELDKENCKKGHLLKFHIETADFIEDVLADPMMDRRKYEQMVCRTRHVSQQINIRMSELFSWPTMHDDAIVFSPDSYAHDIPDGVRFHQYLVDEGKSEGNVRSIMSRVRRVFRHSQHGATHVTFEELLAMLNDMDNIVPNQGSADNCRVAIRHYMKAMFGHDDREV